MSRVTNEPRIKNKIIAAVREQLEHRALWLYLLRREALEKGLDPQKFGRDAIQSCGLYQGNNLSEKAGTKSLRGLKKALFTRPAQWVFEMDVLKSTDDALDIDFHYCPLVKAWQKMGCTDEEIVELCDIAMCGDRGIAKSFGGHLDLLSSIAEGAPTCQIRFRKD